VEACNLRDFYKELTEAGYEILGVSKDTERKQKNFSDKYNFPFPLLADTEREVLEAFGVWGTKKFMGRTFDGIHRKTFIIDEKGVVVRVIDKVKSKEHASQILAS
jgi:peroxiredoxin Q/BCP